MTDAETKPSKPWHWPGEWARDYSWWRDVSSRAVAGLIVVFAVWGVGVAVGAFSDPVAVTGFFNVGLVLLALLAVFALVYQVRILVRHSQGKPVIKEPSPKTTIMPMWVFLGQIIGTIGFVALLIMEVVHRVFLGNDSSLLFPPF